MARISRAQYEANKQKLDDHIWELFKTEGWEAVTYSRLAKFMCTRKSTIQGYYPSSAHFLEGIEGRGFPEMLPLLDMSSPEAFLDSFAQGIKLPLFKNVFELFVLDGVQGISGSHAKKISTNMKTMGKHYFGMDEQEAEHMYKMIIGTALSSIIESNSI